MSMKGEFQFGSIFCLRCRFKAKIVPLAEQLEPLSGGKVTGMLGEAMEALQRNKVEEASDTVDLASVSSSLTLRALSDAPSSSSASGDAANYASASSSLSA